MHTCTHAHMHTHAHVYARAHAHACTHVQSRYNTWAAVETVAYAQEYTAKMIAGFSLKDGSDTFHVQVPASKLLLGYPSTPKGAGTGYIVPGKIASMVTNLTSNGLGKQNRIYYRLRSAHRFSTPVQHTHRTLPISVLIDCPIFFAFVSDTPASIDIRLEAILFGFAKSIYTPEYACNWNIVPLNCG